MPKERSRAHGTDRRSGPCARVKEVIVRRPVHTDRDGANDLLTMNDASRMQPDNGGRGPCQHHAPDVLPQDFVWLVHEDTLSLRTVDDGAMQSAALPRPPRVARRVCVRPLGGTSRRP